DGLYVVPAAERHKIRQQGVAPPASGARGPRHEDPLGGGEPANPAGVAALEGHGPPADRAVGPGDIDFPARRRVLRHAEPAGPGNGHAQFLLPAGAKDPSSFSVRPLPGVVREPAAYEAGRKMTPL